MVNDVDTATFRADVQSGDRLQVRMRASPLLDTPAVATVELGAFTATWELRTRPGCGGTREFSTPGVHTSDIVEGHLGCKAQMTVRGAGGGGFNTSGAGGGGGYGGGGGAGNASAGGGGGYLDQAAVQSWQVVTGAAARTDGLVTLTFLPP